MKANLLFFLFFYLFFVSCSSLFENQSEYEIYSDEIVSNYLKNCRKINKLRLIGKGGRIAEDVQTIDLILETSAIHNIESARIFIVEKEEEFLNLLNTNEAIRSHLVEFPWDSNMFDLTIAFTNRAGDFMPPPAYSSCQCISRKSHVFHL